MPDESKKDGFMPRNRMTEFFAEKEAAITSDLTVDLENFNFDYWNLVSRQLYEDGEL